MADQDSRIRIKRSTTTGQVPTVAPSTDHTDGTWDALDVYVGELFLNTVDDRMWVRTDNGIKELCVDCNCVKSATLTLTSAQILALNSTPIAFGITPASGKYIHVLSADAEMDFQTTAYATNGRLNVRTVGATQPQAQWAANFMLFGTVSRRTKASIGSGTGVTDTQIIVDADLEAFVEVGDPTAGDSPVTITVLYLEL